MPTPYILPQLHAISDVPSAGDTDFWLVVVSPDLMTATYGHGPIPLSLNFLSIYFDNQTDDTAFPHMFHHSHASVPTLPLSKMPTFI